MHAEHSGHWQCLNTESKHDLANWQCSNQILRAVVHAYSGVEPLNKGQFGASHVDLCREVVLFFEVQNVLVLWEW